MEWLGTLEGVAEQSLENEQWDRALDQVEEARGILLEIGQEPYTKLEAVVNFTAEFAPKLDKIVTTVIERKFSKVAKVTSFKYFNAVPLTNNVYRTRWIG